MYRKIKNHFANDLRTESRPDLLLEEHLESVDSTYGLYVVVSIDSVLWTAFWRNDEIDDCFAHG